MSKPIIYILHGWAIDPKNEQKWETIRELLHEAGYQTEFLGLPGLTAPLEEVWELDDYVTWVRDRLPSKKKIVLLGHSFGGQICIRLLAKHPKSAEGLILIDSAGIRDQSALARTKRSVFYVLAKVGKTILPFTLARRMLYKAAREEDYYQAPEVQRQTMSNVVSTEVRTDLAQVATQTQIIWGEHDSVTPLWMGEYLDHHLPNSQLTVIPQARHAPQFTHAEQVSAVIVRFLKGLA